MSRVKLRCIMGCPGLKSSYWEKSLLLKIMESTEIYTIKKSYFSDMTPQSVIFGFRDLDTNEDLILNHLLLIFKMYIYNARTTSYLNASQLLIYIRSIPKRNVRM